MFWVSVCLRESLVFLIKPWDMKQGDKKHKVDSILLMAFYNLGGDFILNFCAPKGFVVCMSEYSTFPCG